MAAPLQNYIKSAHNSQTIFTAICFITTFLLQTKTIIQKLVIIANKPWRKIVKRGSNLGGGVWVSSSRYAATLTATPSSCACTTHTRTQSLVSSSSSNISSIVTLYNIVWWLKHWTCEKTGRRLLTQPFCCHKGKGTYTWYSASYWNTTSEALRYGTCSQRLTVLHCTPICSIHNWNEPYLPLPYQLHSWYSFTDRRLS